MPDFKSMEPPARAIRAEDFVHKSALSLTNQPYLRSLYEMLDDPSQEITFIIGAGVSMDSGFPSWDGLLLKLAKKIDHPDFSHLVLQDQDGVLRKAESIFRLIHPSSPQTDHEILKEALYRGTKATKPGPLAMLIARIANQLGGRCRIITTNFDDVIEEAFASANRATVHSHSLFDTSEDEADSSMNVEGCLGYQQWLSCSTRWEHHLVNDELPEDHHHDDACDECGIGVLHIHGMMRRRLDPLRPVILTESSFLRYGYLVRQIIQQELLTRNVILIGMSLNDPDVVGPLWDRLQDSDSRTPHRCIALSVPSVTANESIAVARSYGVAKYEFLETALGVEPIFLKSYSQLLQLLIEMQICASPGSTYLEDESVRYGQRFTRVLEACYQSTGSASEGFTDNIDRRTGFARKMAELIHPDSEAGQALYSPSTDISRMHRQNRRRYDNFEFSREEERFGLFLWLRGLQDGSFPSGDPYTICLVSASTYTHFEYWSQKRVVEIEPHSSTPAATALFRGGTHVANLDLVSKFPIWRGAVAMPVTLPGNIDENSEFDAPVSVGALVLNTNFAVSPDLDQKLPLSILSTYLNDARHLMAEKIQNPLLKGLSEILL